MSQDNISLKAAFTTTCLLLTWLDACLAGGFLGLGLLLRLNFSNQFPRLTIMLFCYVSPISSGIGRSNEQVVTLDDGGTLPHSHSFHLCLQPHHLQTLPARHIQPHDNNLTPISAQDKSSANNKVKVLLLLLLHDDVVRRGTYKRM